MTTSTSTSSTGTTVLDTAASGVESAASIADTTAMPVGTEPGTTGNEHAPESTPAPAPAPAPVRDSGAYSITSFVLGIASVTMGWTLIAPVIGLVLGIMGRRSEPAHRTLSLWGIILNSVMLALTALALALGLIAIFAVLPFVALESVNLG